MKNTLIILIALTGSLNSYGQENEKKVPEPKLATEPVNSSGTEEAKKPELKLVDPTTANKKKVKKAPSREPELKLISK